MKYRATKTFVGKINMRRGQEREITDKALAENLLKAGYIEKVQPAKKKGADNDNS